MRGQRLRVGTVHERRAAAVGSSSLAEASAQVRVLMGPFANHVEGRNTCTANSCTRPSPCPLPPPWNPCERSSTSQGRSRCQRACGRWVSPRLRQAGSQDHTNCAGLKSSAFRCLCCNVHLSYFTLPAFMPFMCHAPIQTRSLLLKPRNYTPILSHNILACPSAMLIAAFL
jgi:hypothetical protein